MNCFPLSLEDAYHEMLLYCCPKISLFLRMGNFCQLILLTSWLYNIECSSVLKLVKYCLLTNNITHRKYIHQDIIQLLYWVRSNWKDVYVFHQPEQSQFSGVGLPSHLWRGYEPRKQFYHDYSESLADHHIINRILGFNSILCGKMSWRKLFKNNILTLETTGQD